MELETNNRGETGRQEFIPYAGFGAETHVLITSDMSSLGKGY